MLFVPLYFSCLRARRERRIKQGDPVAAWFVDVKRTRLGWEDEKTASPLASATSNAFQTPNSRSVASQPVFFSPEEKELDSERRLSRMLLCNLPSFKSNFRDV